MTREELFTRTGLLQQKDAFEVQPTIESTYNLPCFRWNRRPQQVLNNPFTLPVAYQEVLEGCGKHNPFVIVPADQRWYGNHLVATKMVETLEKTKMQFPKCFF